GYILQAKESKLFESYYKGQCIVPEEEWNDFMEALLRPLPCTFRVTGFKSHAKDMLSIVKKDYLNNLLHPYHITTTIIIIRYPDELAWQLDLARKDIRQDGRLKRLHQFLIQETESGYISRQEAVSMIPPLVLQVTPHSKVLDMCAAPGSKTAQLIEFLHSDEDDDGSNKHESSGFVIANDCDNKRCYLMVHQINRLLSANFAVTNMDATNMPNFFHPTTDEVVKFDRILCDVPCSGDGTLRKNVDAWHRWNPGSAHGLHNLQRRILRRGMEMLSEGGLIVYSTCSLNPVENEAVVAHILRTMKGAVELVDIKERLPGLLSEPGRSCWKVMTKTEEWYSSYAEVPQRLHTQLVPTLFPPSEEEVVQFSLHKCMRILPHKQDTGGFFVALLRKNASSLSSSTSSSSSLTSLGVADNDDEKSRNDNDGNNEDEKDDDGGDNEASKKQKHFGYKEDPFIFLKQNDPMWKPIIEFYGISDDFPFDQLMVRCDTGKKRNIYFVSSVIKQLVQKNEDKFKFINFGVKILSRSVSKDVECEFRLVQDGLHLLYPYITKRVVKVTRADVVTLLSSENPYINRFSKLAHDQMQSLDQGGCVFLYEPSPDTDGPNCRLILCGWKGKVSCRSFLPKADRGHYLRLCGAELTHHGLYVCLYDFVLFVCLCFVCLVCGYVSLFVCFV
ncbi:hypothetical protein HELRODRAFT_68497, partial [Helobdella robusta]|uniref:tRNA (cytosine(34)-C(5))-methyltransferase n=1 Tax=Helobdella robusta TaxID=6412 RepID=T1FZF8_HELRO